MPCAFNMQTFVPSLRREETFFFDWDMINLHDPLHRTFFAQLNRVTSPNTSKWNKLLLKALLSLLFPCSLGAFFYPGQNCFIDHKLRLAPRRRFCYNRERWNINIILAHTKCKTVWLRTVSGEYFMLMICAALTSICSWSSTMQSWNLGKY